MARWCRSSPLLMRADECPKRWQGSKWRNTDRKYTTRMTLYTLCWSQRVVTAVRVWVWEVGWELPRAYREDLKSTTFPNARSESHGLCGKPAKSERKAGEKWAESRRKVGGKWAESRRKVGGKSGESSRSRGQRSARTRRLWSPCRTLWVLLRKTKWVSRPYTLKYWKWPLGGAFWTLQVGQKSLLLRRRVCRLTTPSTPIRVFQYVRQKYCRRQVIYKSGERGDSEESHALQVCSRMQVRTDIEYNMQSTLFSRQMVKWNWTLFRWQLHTLLSRAGRWSNRTGLSPEALKRSVKDALQAWRAVEYSKWTLTHSIWCI